MLRALLIAVLMSLSFAASAESSTSARVRPLSVRLDRRSGQGKGNDFLAVVDADPASPTYGQLVTSLATDQKSLRPHHTEYAMPASAMLFANDHGANRTFIFDLRDPLKPRVAASFGKPRRVQHAAQLRPPAQRQRPGDIPVPGPRRPSWRMSGTSGGLVEIDDQRQGGALGPAMPIRPSPDEGLLPYGLAVLPDIDRVLVTNSPMGDDYLLTSNSYQLFRLSDLQLLGTYRLDPGAKLTGHISPEEPRIGPDGAVYIQTLSCGMQRVTGMDSPRPAAKLVHQFPGIVVRRADHRRPLSGAERARRFTASSSSISPMATVRSRFRG